MTSYDPNRSRWIPWAIVGCFLTVIAVNGALIYFAVSSWTGAVTETPFEDGNDYNRVLARSDAEAATGWHAAIEAARVAPGDKRARVVVTVRDTGTAVLHAHAVAQRPIGRTAPVTVKLTQVAPDRFEGEATLAAPGNWEIRVALDGGDATLHATRRVLLP